MERAAANTGTKRWRRIGTNGPLRPPMRYQVAHAIVGDTLYIHGCGGQGSGARSRKSLLWGLDLGTLVWKELDGPRKAVLSSRCNHTLTADGETLVVFGGLGEGAQAVDMMRERKTDHDGAAHPTVRMLSARNVLNDVAIFDLRTRAWTLLDCCGKWPTARRCHTASLVCDSAALLKVALDARRARETRQSSQSSQSDYESDLENFPPEREQSLSSADGRFVVVLGGAGPDASAKGFEVLLPQLWGFETATREWIDLSAECMGQPPPARFMHTATLHDRSLVVTGGLAPGCCAGDAGVHATSVLAFDVDSLTWSTLQVSDEAPTLHGHGAAHAFTKDELLVFGGARSCDVRSLALAGFFVRRHPSLNGMEWNAPPFET